jgi:exopolyphosphatase/guanosine-5'-triphosphate,3'-diphosphate pyrophosphatase
VGHRYGWRTKLLSGQVEAYLAASGVLAGLERIPDSALIFDIGGRSTEFILYHDKVIQRTMSLDIGVVGLYEAHVRSDPPTELELSQVAEQVRQALLDADWGDLREGAKLIGSAGTVTTITAMLLGMEEYIPIEVNGTEVKAKEVASLLAQLRKEPMAKRAKRAGLPKGRADVILPGLVLVTEILSFFRKKSFIASDNGLLEGIWLLNAGCIPVTL